MMARFQNIDRFLTTAIVVGAVSVSPKKRDQPEEIIHRCYLLRVTEASFRKPDPTTLLRHRSFGSQTCDGRGDVSAGKPGESQGYDGSNSGPINTMRNR